MSSVRLKNMKAQCTEARRRLSNLMNNDEKTKHCCKLSPAVNAHNTTDDQICSCPGPYLVCGVSILVLYLLFLFHTEAALLLSLNEAHHFLK